MAAAEFGCGTLAVGAVTGGGSLEDALGSALLPPPNEWVLGLDLLCIFSNSSALTSRSSCSLNWRAMARARPIQLPTCRATFGSRSGPSTMSAMAEVRSISENPTSSMRHQALVFGGALASV